ncbi:hypothetical protein LJB42_003812 [Komagataella kurtzmanii]|nr:hypothetical protein LJB42_003812 [Komagataella kurtzmanii]
MSAAESTQEYAKALCEALKMPNNDQTTLLIGTELNMLGLPDSTGLISRSFTSPWLETSRSQVDPNCKQIESFKLSNSELPDPAMKISTFTDETLFFIFYTCPKDTLQELASRELVKRNWRYHKYLQVWLTKDSNHEPVPNGLNSERGVYIFFDPHNWERVKKEFVLFYQSIM